MFEYYCVNVDTRLDAFYADCTINENDISSTIGKYSYLCIYNYDKNKFRYLKKHLKEDDVIWRFLVDGRYHSRNNPCIFDKDRVENDIIYKGEKDWLKNMKDGFSFVLDSLIRFDDINTSSCHIRAKLFSDFYAELHKKICPDADPVYDNRCYIGIGKHNGNYEGLLEFFIKDRKSIFHKGWSECLAPDIRDNKLVMRKIMFRLDGRDYNISICKNGNSIIHKVDSGKLEDKVVSYYLPGDLIKSANEEILKKRKLEVSSEKFKLGYDLEDYKTAYKNSKIRFVHENVQLVEELNENLLERYAEYFRPVECSNEEAIIADIANLCQDLDIGHFFLDGNTRTAYVFLNMMLLYYGFVPTILDNPNELEVTDIKTLVFKIIKGQEAALRALRLNLLVGEETGCNE